MHAGQAPPQPATHFLFGVLKHQGWVCCTQAAAALQGSCSRWQTHLQQLQRLMPPAGRWSTAAPRCCSGYAAAASSGLCKPTHSQKGHSNRGLSTCCRGCAAAANMLILRESQQRPEVGSADPFRKSARNSEMSQGLLETGSADEVQRAADLLRDYQGALAHESQALGAALAALRALLINQVRKQIMYMHNPARERPDSPQ